MLRLVKDISEPIVGDVQRLQNYQSKSSKSLQSQSSILHDCLWSKDSAKTPCIEEGETTALVFLLKEYWSPDGSRKQGGLRSPKFTQNNSIQFQINKKGD